VHSNSLLRTRTCRRRRGKFNFASSCFCLSEVPRCQHARGQTDQSHEGCCDSPRDRKRHDRDEFRTCTLQCVAYLSIIEFRCSMSSLVVSGNLWRTVDESSVTMVAKNERGGENSADSLGPRGTKPMAFGLLQTCKLKQSQR
jgi:hypothetical protein